MQIVYLPEKGDILLVTMPNGMQIWSQILSVADDHERTVYAVKRDGIDFVTGTYTWDAEHQCWRCRAKDVVL